MRSIWKMMLVMLVFLAAADRVQAQTLHIDQAIRNAAENLSSRIGQGSSILALLKLWIKAFEFNPCIIGSKSPIDFINSFIA